MMRTKFEDCKMRLRLLVKGDQMTLNDPAKVWLDYTQEELDYNYNQRELVKNWDEYLTYYNSESERVRAKLNCRLDISYGPSEDQILDVFPATDPDSPVVVYIHGGAWTRSHKDSNAYLAESFVEAGAAFVSVHFGLVPKVTLDEQVAHNRAAIEWACRNCRDFGANPDRLYVAGHSSGGHHVGMMITTDWERDHGLPANVIKGALACSGMYDLEAPRRSYRNEYLHLDDAAVERLSPIRHIPEYGCPLIIGYGGGEHEEFRRQSKEFAEAWRAHGFVCQEFDMPGLNHFDVAKEFNNPDSPILKAMFPMIR
jgi:arylformamidase